MYVKSILAILKPWWSMFRATEHAFPAKFIRSSLMLILITICVCPCELHMLNVKWEREFHVMGQYLLEMT